MNAYLLSDPKPIERLLAKRLLKSGRRPASWKRFPSGEVFVSVEGAAKKVCVIGRTEPPGDNFFNTMFLLDTLKRAGAKDIAAAIPYFGYARQDRQLRPGDPVTADCLTNALGCAGATRIITIDIHSERIAKGSPIPIVSVSPLKEMSQLLKVRLKGKPCTVVSPDYGARKRAGELAGLLAGGVAWVEKVRDARGGATARSFHGVTRGKTAVLVDDILDTGGTLRAAAGLLRSLGFRELHLCVTHPVFSADARETVRKLRFASLTFCNAIPLAPKIAAWPNVQVVEVSKMMADAVIKMSLP